MDCDCLRVGQSHEGLITVELWYWAAELEDCLGALVDTGRRLSVNIPPWWQDKGHGIGVLSVCAQQIQELMIDCDQMSDTAVVNEMVNLEDLNVNSPVGQVDFERLPRLQRLRLIGPVGLRDLTALRGLSRLRELDLHGIRGFQSLNGIEALDVEKLDLLNLRTLHSVAPLKQVASLRSLWIQGCRKISDVEAIGAVGSLEKLHVDGVASLDWIVSLQRLRWFALINTASVGEDVSVAPVGRLTQLRELRMEKVNNIVDVETLASLADLELLSIHFGPDLRSLAFLRGMKALVNLGCTQTRIVDGDLSVLLELPALREVDVGPHKKHYSHKERDIQTVLDARHGDVLNRHGEHDRSFTSRSASAGDAHTDASHGQLSSPRETPGNMTGIPAQIDLGEFVWVLGEQTFSDPIAFTAAVQEALEEEDDDGTKDGPDFDAVVLPVPRVGIAYWGVGEDGYESMYHRIEASDPRGFTMRDFLLQVNNATCATLVDADHRYLERITLLTPKDVTQHRLAPPPAELQDLPVFYLECGS